MVDWPLEFVLTPCRGFVVATEVPDEFVRDSSEFTGNGKTLITTYAITILFDPSYLLKTYIRREKDRKSCERCN